MKLKRKLEYKQAYLHDTICPEKVITALHHLKNNNPLYGDIEINEDWIRGWRDADSDMYSGVFVDEVDNCDDTTVDNINDSDSDSNE